ncbi:pseudaminic acid cytidylyltransferase [Candidatus Dependentiae bacterium]
MAKCLAIIPARGGSKRIPRKNIKKFCGQPIIKYSIDAAIKSNCFDEVMVSTDDKDIADVAKKCGAKIPFYRSEKNSNDFAILTDVIEEVVLEYKKRNIVFDYVCCILATVPFLKRERLINGLSLLMQHGADAVVPVALFGYPIQRALKISNEKIEMFWPENYTVRSQDLVPAYHDAGQFYWINVKTFFKQKKIFAGNTFSLILPEIEVQDIDTYQDWIIAENKYLYIKNKGVHYDYTKSSF